MFLLAMFLYGIMIVKNYMSTPYYKYYDNVKTKDYPLKSIYITYKSNGEIKNSDFLLFKFSLLINQLASL